MIRETAASRHQVYAMQSADTHNDSPFRAARDPSRRNGLAERLRAERDLAPEIIARGEAIAAIVAGMTDDEEILAGALLFPLVDAGAISAERAAELGGPNAARIAGELQRLGTLSVATPSKSSGALSANQAEGLRKMLLAIVTDPRLLLIKLAAQLDLLRESKDAPPEQREQIAYETREIYAPLANRLGVWQLKWELEDLSFRYIDPENYKRVAGWLAAKRVDRERYIEEVVRILENELHKAGIKAEVAGRPKHIYSIWRKMQRKGLSFDQLYDIQIGRAHV